MHDLDRTLQEFEAEYDAFESFDDELETDFDSGFELDDDEWESDSVFDHAEEMELAAQLLEIQDDDELEYFLGSLIKKAGRSIGKIVRGPVGKALGGVLKSVAKKALPMAGAALGNLVVPGAGGIVGGKLASMAGKALGLELEGLSPDEQEFEVARRIVRLTGNAVKNVPTHPTANPIATAKKAVAKAVQGQHPGFGGRHGHSYAPGGRSGRWFRRGRRIVLTGI